MEQNWELRNKPMLCDPQILIRESRILNGEKIVCSINGIGKRGTGQRIASNMQKNKIGPLFYTNHKMSSV